MAQAANTTNTQQARGFTLIELLVVIAIIGVLAAVVLVNVNSARDKSENGAIVRQVREYATAVQLAYVPNLNRFPAPVVSGVYMRNCSGAGASCWKDTTNRFKSGNWRCFVNTITTTACSFNGQSVATIQSISNYPGKDLIAITPQPLNPPIRWQHTGGPRSMDSFLYQGSDNGFAILYAIPENNANCGVEHARVAQNNEVPNNITGTTGVTFCIYESR
jgi:prepilin-type N-terminal cleavage/methylation domain-containing protein